MGNAIIWAHIGVHSGWIDALLVITEIVLRGTLGDISNGVVSAVWFDFTRSKPKDKIYFI